MQRLHCELPNAIIRQIPDCGHLPHVERPINVSKLIVEFVEDSCTYFASDLEKGLVPIR